MAKEVFDWKQYECQRCGVDFMVRQDTEHNAENTYCPECKKLVEKKISP